MLKKLRSIIILLISACALFFFSRWLNYEFDSSYIINQDIEIIQQKTIQKQKNLIQELKSVASTLVNQQMSISQLMDSLYHEDNQFLVYKDTTLIGWSNQNIIPNSLNQFESNRSVIKLANGWYINANLKVHNYTFIGLSPIKKQFSYQNNFLKNQFHSSYDLTTNPELLLSYDKSIPAIYDQNKFYLFSLVFEKQQIKLHHLQTLSLLLSLLSFILFIIAGSKMVKRITTNNQNLLASYFGIIYLSALYILFIRYGAPDYLNKIELFSPVSFAVSKWLPSLGALLIISILNLIFSYWIYRYINFSKYSFSTKWLFLIGITGLISYFQLIGWLINLAVNNSSHTSLFFHIKDFNFVSFTEIAFITLLTIAFLFLSNKFIATFRTSISKYQSLLLTLIVVVSFVIISIVISDTFSIVEFTFIYIYFCILILSKRNSKNQLAFGYFLLIIILFSSYNIYSLYQKNLIKEKKNREFLIENLSFKLTKETDPTAELYLHELESKIYKDTVLQKLLSESILNNELIETHIRKNYFVGYWSRYETQIITCWPQAKLHIKDSDVTTGCYQYFNNMLLRNGIQVDNTSNFYFLENNNGRITYFGALPFFQGYNLETTLYIEINSKPHFQGLGYPELLTSDEEQLMLGSVKEYSYAKYQNNELVKQYGNYKYPVELTKTTTKIGIKRSISQNEMKHLIYNPNNKVTIILSRENVKPFLILLGFSIFFILTFIFSSGLLILIRYREEKIIFRSSIHERMQYTFIGLIMTLLFVMGISIVKYSIHQYERNNEQMLSQRIKSVLLELEDNIGNEAHIKPEMKNYLEYLLRRFSNIFFTDINLYNQNGKLVATSRPELFKKGITGTNMNPQALYELRYKLRNEYIQQESIGLLTYTSAYLPLYNNSNQLLGYINLPYFVGTNELKEQVSSLLVAVINAYFIFTMLAIGIAILISQRITRPLNQLQEALRKVKLGKRNNKIDYKKEDEIGQLVTVYNTMVDELEKSALKLATSERESAWREMAKQIAHEIKNPLTPMKLSVQYLMKSWNDKKDDFDSFLERFTNTMTEQIDQLHRIANEFSNFARMPNTKYKSVNITEKIDNVLALFQKSERNISFEFKRSPKDIYVTSDPDQLVSVFNNLIKNSVQAIPQNIKGKITILLKEDTQNAIIKITDNGNGISKEIIPNIFKPNFTTKTSGTGIGLAIVKNIIINSEGTIDFKTQEGKGTTFTIKIPIAKQLP